MARFLKVGICIDVDVLSFCFKKAIKKTLLIFGRPFKKFRKVHVKV